MNNPKSDSPKCQLGIAFLSHPSPFCPLWQHTCGREWFGPKHGLGWEPPRSPSYSSRRYLSIFPKPIGRHRFSIVWRNGSWFMIGSSRIGEVVCFAYCCVYQSPCIGWARECKVRKSMTRLCVIIASSSSSSYQHIIVLSSSRFVVTQFQ